MSDVAGLYDVHDAWTESNVTLGLKIHRMEDDAPLAYLLTPWSIALLEKLTGLKLAKELSEFYGTRRFITAFTIAHRLSLALASSIQSMPTYPTS